jgi:hypothetical protein
MIQRFIAGDHGGRGRVVGLIALHQVSSDRLLGAGPYCPPQLNTGVDMTSGVKGFLENASSVHCHCLLLDYRKRRSQLSRRLITRISVSWVPPDVCPSSVGLALGPRVSGRRVTPARMAPTRGCFSCDRLSLSPDRWGLTVGGREV